MLSKVTNLFRIARLTRAKYARADQPVPKARSQRSHHLKRFVLFLAALCAPSAPSFAQGTLGTGSISFAAPVTNGAVITFSVRDGGTGTSPAIFNTIRLTAADLGRQFPITSADDPDFDPLVALLTNGTSDAIAWTVDLGGGGPGHRGQENSFFTLPPGGNGIDFYGFHIDNISLRLDAMTPGSLAATISVNSLPIPEPGAATLVACAACLIALSRFAFDRRNP